jgi:hypothetical protein
MLSGYDGFRTARTSTRTVNREILDHADIEAMLLRTRTRGPFTEIMPENSVTGRGHAKAQTFSGSIRFSRT